MRWFSRERKAELAREKDKLDVLRDAFARVTREIREAAERSTETDEEWGLGEWRPEDKGKRK